MRYLKVLLPLLTLLVLTLPAWSQSNNPYELTWLFFDNGGTATGGQYQVAATFGQLDNRQLTGGEYSLSGRLGNDGEATSVSTVMPTTTSTTSAATPTPVTDEAATPTPSPITKLYLPAMRR